MWMRAGTKFRLNSRDRRVMGSDGFPLPLTKFPKERWCYSWLSKDSFGIEDRQSSETGPLDFFHEFREPRRPQVRCNGTSYMCTYSGKTALARPINPMREWAGGWNKGRCQISVTKLPESITSSLSRRWREGVGVVFSFSVVNNSSRRGKAISQTSQPGRNWRIHQNVIGRT